MTVVYARIANVSNTITIIIWTSVPIPNPGTVVGSGIAACGPFPSNNIVIIVINIIVNFIVL